MTAMHREKQYDMFDVATGACTLEDYLFQRYSENDLASTFWIEPTDEVDELRPPKPLADGQPGTEPEIIPIQGPRADKKKAEEAAAKAAAARQAAQAAQPEAPLEASPPAAGAAPETAIPDGRDSLASSSPQESATPSLESFKSGSSSQSAPGLENFQSQKTTAPPETPSLERVDIRGEDTPAISSEAEEKQPQPGAPAPPSMEDLLAQFHQATQEHKERVFVEDEEADSNDQEASGEQSKSSFPKFPKLPKLPKFPKFPGSQE